MIRRPPRSTLDRSSAASDVYKRQGINRSGMRLQRRIAKFTTYMDIVFLIDKKEVINNQENNCEIDFVLKQVQLKNINAHIDRKGDLVFDHESAVLKINEKHLEYLFDELIENALKFSEAGTPIEIIGRSNGDVYKFQINDFGQGMTESDTCLLYTSDAADERCSVDLGGPRTIKKKKTVEMSSRQIIYKK